MKSLVNIKNIHPFVKLIVFMDLNILILEGSLYISLFIALAGYVFLSFFNDKNKMLGNPHKSLVFCIITFLLVFFFMENTKEEIIQLIFFTLKLFALIIFSILTSLFMAPVDLLNIFNSLRIPKKHYPILISIIRFIPITIKDLTSIIFAQRSRGLQFNIKSIFRLTTYLSIAVPYITSILNNVIQTDITLAIRDFDLKLENPRLGLLDSIILSFCVLIWFVPSFSIY